MTSMVVLLHNAGGTEERVEVERTPEKGGFYDKQTQPRSYD